MLDNSEERAMLLLLRSERLFSERHGYKLKKGVFLYKPASTICDNSLTEKQLGGRRRGGEKERSTREASNMNEASSSAGMGRGAGVHPTTPVVFPGQGESKDSRKKERKSPAAH